MLSDRKFNVKNIKVSLLRSVAEICLKYYSMYIQNYHNGINDKEIQVRMMIL